MAANGVQFNSVEWRARLFIRDKLMNHRIGSRADGCLSIEEQGVSIDWLINELVDIQLRAIGDAMVNLGERINGR